MMNNMVATIFPKSFPIFEPNQVLTNTHLNELRQYLEGEDKLTRSKAIGTGIINGLTYEIAPDNSSITLSAGTGITSEGFIIHTEFGEQETYTKAMLYDKKSRPKLDITYEEKDGILEEKDATPEGTKFYELIPDSDQSVDPNKVHDVKTLLSSIGRKGLLVFLEENDIDIKSCFTTNCDDRGKQRHYMVKPMLVILPEGEESLPISVKDFSIVDLALQRINIPFSNSPGINKRYQTILNDKFLSNVQKALINLFNFYVPALEDFSEDEPTLPNIELIELRNSTLHNTPYFSQYFYDFIEDLIEAYYEFFDQMDKVNHLLPNRSSHFRRHLLLGSITGKELIFQRDEFRPARIDEDDFNELKTAHFLLNRIRALIHSFKIEKVDKIKITPSAALDRSLANRPIPYYYGAILNTELHKHWDAHLAQRDKSYQVLSYHNVLYNKNPNDQFSKPLNFFHNRQQRLKIEGHIGRQKSEVISELIKLRRDNRLSFDIVALRVGEIGELGEIIQKNECNEEFKEHNFKDFLEKHHGSIHERAVLKGGTIIIIYQTKKNELDGEVIADLSLPYSSCCCAQRDPVVLKAIDDEVKVDANSTVDIHVLKNDCFDLRMPLEIEFVKPIARDVHVVANTNASKDIQVLDTQEDPDDIELDFDTSIGDAEEEISDKALDAEKI